MPVPIKDLLAGRIESDLRAEARPAKLLRFLRKNSTKAYSAAELADEFETDHRTLRSVLARLHDRGLVEKRDEYWFALSVEDAAQKRMFLARARDLDERLGPERKEDWPSVPQPASRKVPARPARTAELKPEKRPVHHGRGNAPQVLSNQEVKRV